MPPPAFCESLTMHEKNALRIILSPHQLATFFPILQRGVWLQVQVGCGVMSLLTKQFGISADYVRERITTLFLDGKPIDNLETSTVNDGATLALSAAMPGLVGATMRRGGHLAAMRGSITYHSEKKPDNGTGRVKVKLFNMVMTELGALFLAYGIRLTYAELSNFLAEQEDSFWQSFGLIILDGQQIDQTRLKKQLSQTDPAEKIILYVEFKG